MNNNDYKQDGLDYRDELNETEGCACEANILDEVDQLVDEVEGYGRDDRREKKAELRDAFGEQVK